MATQLCSEVLWAGRHRIIQTSALMAAVLLCNELAACSRAPGVSILMCTAVESRMMPSKDNTWLPHHDGTSVSKLKSDDGLGEELQVSIEGDEDGLGHPAQRQLPVV